MELEDLELELDTEMVLYAPRRTSWRLVVMSGPPVDIYATKSPLSEEFQSL